MRLSSSICSRWDPLKLVPLSRASSRALRSTSFWSEDPGRFRAKQFWFLRSRNYICSSKSTQTNIAASSLFVMARTNVAGTYADKTRSEFGEFVRTQDVMLREGLLGGVLSTAWPMLDADVRKAKVNYEGEKRVENRQLQVLRYRPKKATDLIIFLYFDPETFRHVMTSYELTIRPTVVSEIKNARQQEIRYRIEERFGDFKVVDGLTLPSHYDLRFTEELQNGFTKSLEWDVTTTRVLNNVSLDPRNFQF